MSRMCIYGEKSTTSVLVSLLGLTHGRHNLEIKTKYYSCSVLVATAHTDTDLITALETTEALVIIPSENSQDLALISSLDFGDYVRLLICSKNAKEELKQQYEEWSVDNGFECIEIDFAHPFPGGRSIQNVFKIRLTDCVEASDQPFAEKTGVSRVMEALECNAWRDMRRSEVSTSSAIQEALAHTTERGDERIDEEEADIQLHDLSSTMEKAIELRRQVESNAFSDEERRRRAAEMALQLSKLMELDAGDDSD